MDIQKREMIRDVFKKLEVALSGANSTRDLFKSDADFAEVFSAAQKGLGILENEWIIEEPKTFNYRDAIVDVIDRLEILQAYVIENRSPKTDEPLGQQLAEAKSILREANCRFDSQK